MTALIEVSALPAYLLIHQLLPSEAELDRRCGGAPCWATLTVELVSYVYGSTKQHWCAAELAASREVGRPGRDAVNGDTFG